MDWAEIKAASNKVLPKEAADSDPEVLYTSVGRALSYWEALQFSLSFLFAACSGAALVYPVMRAFGHSMLVTAKLDMIQYAAEASLPQHKDLLLRVTDLVKSLREYNNRRNDIAHGVVQIFDASTYYLIPSGGTSRKYPVYAGGVALSEPNYCWNSTQIDRYTKAFQQLGNDCGALTLDVKGAVDNAVREALRKRTQGSSRGKPFPEEG